MPKRSLCRNGTTRRTTSTNVGLWLQFSTQAYRSLKLSQVSFHTRPQGHARRSRLLRVDTEEVSPPPPGCWHFPSTAAVTFSPPGAVHIYTRCRAEHVTVADVFPARSRITTVIILLRDRAHIRRSRVRSLLLLAAAAAMLVCAVRYIVRRPHLPGATKQQQAVVRSCVLLPG